MADTSGLLVALLKVVGDKFRSEMNEVGLVPGCSKRHLLLLSLENPDAQWLGGLRG